MINQFEIDARLAIVHALLALKSQGAASDEEVIWAKKWFEDRKIQLNEEHGTGRYFVAEETPQEE